MDEEIRNCYRVLEIEPGASLDAVKDAYRQLVKIWHPDRFPDDLKLQKRAKDKTTQIILAYRTIIAWVERTSRVAAEESEAYPQQAQREEMLREQQRRQEEARRHSDRFAPPPSATPTTYGNIDIAGSQLRITSEVISFKKTTLKTAEIVGIRYGVFKSYTNGIRTNQSYCIWLTDSKERLEIECASGFVFSSSKIEERYCNALKALWPAVIVPMTNRFLTPLLHGSSFEVGGIVFDKFGLHKVDSMGAFQKGMASVWHSIAGGKTPEQRAQDYQHLSWADFTGHNLCNGQINLLRGKNVWATFSLRDTWNAVCLDPLLNFCYEKRLLATLASI